MNIRNEILDLQENASLLDKAEFAVKFLTIAEEVNRLQNLQQTDCSKLRELVAQKKKEANDASSYASNDFMATGAANKASSYENVLKLIDELQPVA